MYNIVINGIILTRYIKSSEYYFVYLDIILWKLIEYLINLYNIKNNYYDIMDSVDLYLKCKSTENIIS